MKYFLDTNICIYFLKGMYPKLKEKLLNHSPEMIVIPSITKAELLYGAEKSQRKEENLEKISEFLLPYRIQGFNDAETTAYAVIRKELEEKGTLIGPNDMIIASIVLANNGVLITKNTKEFNRIKGLEIEDWTE